jgi:hypothetical protein
MALALPRVGPDASTSSRPFPGPYVAFLAADLAVFALRFPWLGGRQGLSPAPGYGAFAVAIGIRAAVLMWIVWLCVRRRPRYLQRPPGAPARQPAAVAS